jgi:hypothetical protein
LHFDRPTLTLSKSLLVTSAFVRSNPVKLSRSGLLVAYIKLKWFTGTEPRN